MSVPPTTPPPAAPDQEPPTEPAHGAPAARSGRRRGLTLVIGAGAVLVAAGVAVAVAVSNSTPEPITRAELLSRYAELHPRDRSATPDNIDATARTACEGLAKGFTADQLVTTATRMYGPQATEIMKLFVAYGCPDKLDQFDK